MDLTAAAVERHYPESVETWKGHGRKIKMNLRSTKELIKDEQTNRQKVLSVLEAPLDDEMEGLHHRVYDLPTKWKGKYIQTKRGVFQPGLTKVCNT